MHHIDQNIVAKEFLFSKEELLEIIDLFGERLIYKNLLNYSFFDIDGKTTSIDKAYDYLVKLISLTNKLHILDSLIRRNKYTLSTEDLVVCTDVLEGTYNNFLSIIKENSVQCPILPSDFTDKWYKAKTNLNWNKVVKDILILRKQFKELARTINIFRKENLSIMDCEQEAMESLVIIFTLVLNYISKRC